MIDRLRVPVAALLVATLVLACSESTPTATPPAPPTQTPPTANPSTASPSPATGPATIAPLPTVTNTGTAASPPCLLADLKASHGLVEGAADSRDARVVLVSAGTCSVDAFPALRLRDSSGADLLSAPSERPGAINLVPGAAYTSDVRVSNWCAPDPSFPLSLLVVLGEGELAVNGGSFPEDSDLPPCNGATGPTLEATAWTASF
jgi:hypothetical protein